MTQSLIADIVEQLRSQAQEMLANGTPRSEVASFLHARGQTMSDLFPPLPADQLVAGTDLLPHHRRELCEGSGLSMETIVEAGIHSETSAAKLKILLNWPKMAARAASGIVIPFHNLAGAFTGFSRFKPDNPRKDRDGKPVKYESPRGVPNRVYFPPKTIDQIADPTVQLLITEGEKKTLKADQEGFPCIGLTGVFAWKEKGREQFLSDLEQIEWKGRPVKIVFDSDAADKPCLLYTSPSPRD